jgi:hypothetical protein
MFRRVIEKPDEGFAPGHKILMKEAWRIVEMEYGSVWIEGIDSNGFCLLAEVRLPQEEYDRLRGESLEDIRRSGHGDKIYGFYWEENPLRWRDGATMYDEMCRAQLEVLATRQEHLHDISLEDLQQEGIRHADIVGGAGFGLAQRPGTWAHVMDSPQESFKNVWNTRYRWSGDYTWDANPLIQVVTFSIAHIRETSPILGRTCSRAE